MGDEQRPTARHSISFLGYQNSYFNQGREGYTVLGAQNGLGRSWKMTKGPADLLSERGCENPTGTP